MGRCENLMDRELYEQIFEYSPTPSAVFELGGACVAANRAFIIKLGYDPQTFFKKEIIAFKDIFEHIDAAKKFALIIQQREIIRRFEIKLKTQDGYLFPVLLSGRIFKRGGKTLVEISFTDVKRSEELSQSFRREYKRPPSLLDNLTVGVFLVNRGGIIIDANQTLSNFFHIPLQVIIARPYQALFSNLLIGASEPMLLQRWLEDAVLNVAGKPHFEFTQQVQQQQIHFETTFFPVWDEEGIPIGWGGLMQDITELREQINWKMDLISMLAHDIRSPLATLKGHATALLDSYMQWSPTMVQDFLETINKGVDTLVRQVERNLALTRVEAGRLGLRPEGILPGQLIDLAVERVAGLLDGWQIEIDMPENLPKVRSDPARVEEVIINLLENAAHYASEKQKIKISVWLSDAWCEFTVRDYGSGISAENHEKIFEKYGRGQAGGDSTGLGLFISRKIIEAHGGKIWIESPVSGTKDGTAVHFTIPVMPTVQPIEKPLFTSEEIISSPLKLEHREILIVEDDPAYQALLRNIMMEAGYHVEIAPDSTTGFNIIQAASPDLVLLDWMLPGVSGIELVRSIRRWSSIPIIMLTSKTAQDDIVAAFDAGVDDYIVKPFLTEELLARTRALLRRGDTWEFEAKSPHQYQVRNLLIDYHTRQVWVSGKLISTTATEFNLLAYLTRNPHRVLSYGQIIQNVWSENAEVTRHALSVHISRLRQKIEKDPRDPAYIVTKWGIGYMFRL